MKPLLLLLSFLTTLANADIYTRSQASVGLSLGKGESFGRTYTVAGVNAEYFILDNFGVGAMYRAWVGAYDTQNELSLSGNYFFPIDRKYRPYLGAFVRHTFVSGGYEDFTSLGFRGGVSYVINKESYLSFGYAFEYYETCAGMSECNRRYPEIVAGFSF